MIHLSGRKYSLRIFIFTLFIVIASCKKTAQVEHNKSPIANAGNDTTIFFPNRSVLLNGTASNDPEGNIASFSWTKISGPADFKLKTPNNSQTTADSLKEGVYQFELKVTDSKGLFDKDTIQITCAPANRPPVADASPDQTILLSVPNTTLYGSNSSDPDNNIKSYLWTKISGPASFIIANDTAVQTQVSNFVEGIYQFELKVTDALGLSDKDTIQITCKPPNRPPTAYAGKDTTIMLASCGSFGSGILNGSGSTDPDANIRSYSWTNIYANGYSLSHEAIASVNYLIKGKYLFELVVTDSGGLSSRDTVQITVINTNVPTEYNLNINLSDTFTFQDNYYYNDPYDGPYYNDITNMKGSCDFAPIGNLNFGINENDDSASTHYTNARLELSQGDNIYAGGDLNVSLKNLIQSGGGTFTGLYKVKQGSADRCSPGIFNNEFYPVILNVTGTLTITSTENNGSTIKGTLSMNVTGKIYF